MKHFASTTLAVGALLGAVLGFAGTATADTGHNQWVNQMSSQSNVYVPHVDTTVHH